MVWSAEFLTEVILCQSQGKKGLDPLKGNPSISFYLILGTASCTTHVCLALARQRVVIFMSVEESD